MSDAVEAQVMEFIATTAEVAPERIVPTSRLLHDLGIDGDDAVELFDAINKRFGTDLTSLYERWREHFGPEGIPLSAALVVIPCGLASAMVAVLVDDFTGEIPARVVGFVLAVILIVGLIWIARGFKLTKDVTPITVAEVVQAVRVGVWPRATQ